MKRNLLIVGGLMGIIIVLISIGIALSPNSDNNYSLPDLMNSYEFNSADEDSTYADNSNEYLTFDNSTSQSTAISIARLHEGPFGYASETINNAYLTSDGKYWIVDMENMGDYGGIFTIDAKTWKCKKDDGEWKSLDELKASYIAEVQNYGDGFIGEPQKIVMDGKEIWKVPVDIYLYYESGIQLQREYVYVDLTTGKSKNTWNVFNNAAGTDGWLTLKQVDKTRAKMGIPGESPFKDALRSLYPE